MTLVSIMPPKKDNTPVNQDRARDNENIIVDDDNEEIEELEDDDNENNEGNELIRGQKAAAARKKNQERFESIERAIENMSKAIQGLVKQKDNVGANHKQTVAEVHVNQEPQISRTSTLKRLGKNLTLTVL